MRFVVDAHVAPRLCAVLQAAGHEAIHTRQLADQNRTSDEVINDLSLKEQRVVVTKDSDFYHSHLLHGRPWKLLLIRTGNLRARELILLFEAHLPAIIAALEQSSLVELDHQRVQVIK